MPSSEVYKVVQLKNGARSVHSQAHNETMHPGLGPVAEAEALYVKQLGLAERVRTEPSEFVIWDVGLGAGANALTMMRNLRGIESSLRLISFDKTQEPFRFAVEQRGELGYFDGYEAAVEGLLASGRFEFVNGCQKVRWDFRLGDFPSFLGSAPSRSLPKPHVVLFDPWSPSRNPAMWTAPLFADLFRLLDPARSCVLPTYSRSTMLRVALLLAGFFVGSGQATGLKEETTIAANRPDSIANPLDGRWLERARRSRSAEPLWEPVYRQAPLAEPTWERLRQHPQFQAGRP